MKKITLQKLTLNNFKGFTFEMAVDGADVNICGANATGKTTLADAFSWLLFDKDSLGRADFEIKNLDGNGQEEHGLEHSVEGALWVDGNTTTLKKAYKEIWTKKRGSATPLFSGHTTDYYVNGVPCQKKDYVATVADLAGEESVFRLLTSPTVFPSLHWQKQRSLLLEVCGDMTDAQVIEADSKLSALTDILGNRTIDDHRKVIAARRTEINKALETIPVRIDEVRRGLPDVTGLNRKASDEAVSNLEAGVSEARLRLQGVDNGAAITALSKQLANLDVDIRMMENKHYLNHTATVTKLNHQIDELKASSQTSASKVQALTDSVTWSQTRVDGLNGELDRLRDKWVAVDSETFHDTTEDTCAACGQSLPHDRVQEARDKALAAFNLHKAERLGEIETKGKTLAAERDRIKAEIVPLRLERDKLIDAASNAPTEEIERLTAERDNKKRIAEDYSLIEGRAVLLAQRQEIEKKIQAEKDGVAQERTDVAMVVAELEEQLKAAKAVADKFPRREAGEKRIEELKAEEKKLAAEFERLEQELFLCESFVKTKVRLLEERINQKFEFVRFRLFETQVNQGISECCELTINGVPYSGGLNSAARTQGGLDIIRTLQAHYGLQSPIFIDNRESCTEIPNMSCQIISLYVSPNDAALRVDKTHMEPLLRGRHAA